MEIEAPSSIPVEHWPLILADSLPHADLRSLCKRYGLEFPGTRLKAVTAIELACALTAEIVMAGSPEDRARIERQVAAANARLLERLRLMKPREIGRWILSATAPDDGPGAVLWALYADGRRALKRLATKLGGVLVGAAKASAAGIPAAPPAPAPAEPPPPELERRAERVRDAVADLVREATAATGRYVHELSRRRELEGHVESHKKEIAERDARIAERKREVEGFVEKLREAESRIEGLRDRRPAMTDREARKLRYDLEQATRRIAELEGREREAGELRARVEAREAELAALREDLAAAKAPKREEEPARAREERRRERPAPSRDADAVELLADVQSLYVAAARRGRRVDFRGLMRAASPDRRPARAVAYVVDLPNVKSDAFKIMLREAGYAVRVRRCEKSEADRAWVGQIAADLREAARRSGRVVLVSHNGRLSGAVAETRAAVAGFPEDLPAELTSAAAETIALTEAAMLPAR